MATPIPQMIGISDDDELWIVRVSPDQMIGLDHAVPSWAAAHTGVPKWEVTPPLTTLVMPVEGEPKGAFQDGFSIVQGINGTGFINAITQPVEGEGLLSHVSLFGDELIGLEELIELAEDKLAELNDFDEAGFLARMETRPLAVTQFELENLVFLHFPIWTEADAPEGATYEEKLAHKKAAVDYVFGRTALEKAFLPRLLTKMTTNLANLDGQARAENFKSRTLEFDGDKFVDTDRALDPKDFAGCNCPRAMPIIIRFPVTNDLAEACEIVICERVNGMTVCRVVTVKPYASTKPSG